MKTTKMRKSGKKKVKKIKKSGFGLCKGMKPFSKEDKLRGQLEENE